MSLLQDLTGSLLWVTLFSVVLFSGGIVAIGFLTRQSALLKPMGSGLKIIAFFVSVQVFLLLGGHDYYPRFSKHLDFFSWLIFIFGALRLGLYIYGDLFVVRLKRGSFPAAFKNIITVFIVLVVALILLKEILNINVTSLIATTTVLTATIGLAFQSTLANMLAGLTIHLEKPLKQGDWISAGGHEGHVLDITLRSTRIKTIENNEVFIPNSKVLSEAVVNYSLPNTTMVRKLPIGVSYHIPPNRVKQVVLEVLSNVAGVSATPAPLVRVVSYSDFSVHYEIRYALTDFSRHVDVEAEIMSLIWYHFKRNDIEIPYPIRDINVRQVTTESCRAEEEKRAAGIISLMEKVEILAPLSKAELGELVQQVSIQSFAAGETAVQQGEPGDSFYIIKKGRVEVIVEKAEGEAVVVATLGQGNFFGEMSLLTGAVRTASIRVKEDAEFIVIYKESFRSTLANNPSIAEAMSRLLSERQAGLIAGRERLDATALERHKNDASGKLLSKIRDFFGLTR
jgi:small-conductance mechanosensitive channel/CRP-like cAMP-binding protein